MVTCVEYERSCEAQWDSFVEASRTPLFFFKRGFLEYHSDRFVDSSLMFYEDDVLVAVMPATLHGSTMISHGGVTYGGFIYPAKIRASTLEGVFHCLHQWALNQGINKVTYKAIPYIFQVQPAQEDLYFLHTILNGVVTRRDLSSVIYLADRLKLSKGRKWLIARAKKSGLSVTTSHRWSDFHTLLSDVLAKHDAKPIHSVQELELLTSRFQDHIELKTVVYEDSLIAGALLFRFGNVVHTQYLATSDLGKEMGALDFLIESIIEDSRIRGYEYFSFGISTEDQGRTLNDGLLQQKESFGARGMIVDFYEITLQ